MRPGTANRGSRKRRNYVLVINLFLPAFLLGGGGQRSKARAHRMQTEKISWRGSPEEQLSHSLCYAFLKQGNLFVQCNGTLMQITKEGNVTDFAVSQTGTAMVLMRKQGTKKLNDGFGTPIMELQIDPLKTGGDVRTLPIGSKFGGLAASCGTAIFLYRTTKDLVSGRNLDFEPYSDFRCSSNRQEIAGQVELDSRGAIVTGLPTGNDHSALASGLPPKVWLADSGSEGFGYDVSTNGEYLAYYMPKELCLVRDQTTKSCVNNIDASREISVSDSGDVFFTTQTDATCSYEDSLHVSLGPRPGYDIRDRCIAVAVLQNGKRVRTILQPLARHPQWLTAEAASAIAKWQKIKETASKSLEHGRME